MTSKKGVTMEKVLKKEGATTGTFGYDKAFAVSAAQTMTASEPAKIPEPVKVNPLKSVEDAVEQNDNSFDGIINNVPLVANSEMSSANPTESREDRKSVLEQLQAQTQQTAHTEVPTYIQQQGHIPTQGEREL